MALDGAVLGGMGQRDALARQDRRAILKLAGEADETRLPPATLVYLAKGLKEGGSAGEVAGVVDGDLVAHLMGERCPRGVVTVGTRRLGQARPTRGTRTASHHLTLSVTLRNQAITNRRGPANETGDARSLHMGSVRTLIAPSWSSTVA